MRYTTNTIDPVPQAFALKCGMRLVHRAPMIFHITDAATDYVERECALILAEQQRQQAGRQVRSPPLLKDQVAALLSNTIEPIPLLPSADQNTDIVAHLVQTKLFGNGYLHADWKSKSVSAGVLAPHVSAGEVWTMCAPLAADSPAEIDASTRLPTSVSIFSGASGAKYTGTIGATCRAEFLLHLRTHLRQFARYRAAVTASSPAAIASAYRFECWYSPALHPSEVQTPAGSVDPLSERDVAAICAAPNPYTGTRMLVWERDLSPEIAAAKVETASAAQL